MDLEGRHQTQELPDSELSRWSGRRERTAVKVCSKEVSPKRRASGPLSQQSLRERGAEAVLGLRGH